MVTVKLKRANKKKEEEWMKTPDKTFNILICYCPFKLCCEYGCKGYSASIHLSCTCPAIARNTFFGPCGKITCEPIQSLRELRLRMVVLNYLRKWLKILALTKSMVISWLCL